MNKSSGAGKRVAADVAKGKQGPAKKGGKAAARKRTHNLIAALDSANAIKRSAGVT